ncbi:hypothetical protein DFH08DRAFT_1086621 [Mycena albidolilacea]|uniref:Uncharacterized protein n=1 Tax=Mycena albidolilacea TaxID=1033008 RepID=A0AAD7EEJ7_9AGAR|nr:hypothetical protein DFH08DRAFT_1086621 [Mycena albidolilacea]
MPHNYMGALFLIGQPTLGRSAEHTSFPHTHKLTVEMNLSDDLNSSIYTIVTEFPGLRVLAILHYAGYLTIQKTTSYPLPGFDPPLRDYTGPYETLNMFLHLPTLTHLTLTYCDVRDMIKGFGDIGVQDGITSLRVLLATVCVEEIKTLCGFFPGLTRLRLECEDGVFNRNTTIDNDRLPRHYRPPYLLLLQTLTESLSLPSHLKQIGLVLHERYEKLGTGVLPNVRQHFIVNHPA